MYSENIAKLANVYLKILLFIKDYIYCQHHLYKLKFNTKSMGKCERQKAEIT